MSSPEHTIKPTQAVCSHRWENHARFSVAKGARYYRTCQRCGAREALTSEEWFAAAGRGGR